MSMRKRIYLPIEVNALTHYYTDMDINFEEITNRILAENDYSETTLAEMVGVSQTTIHRIKKGSITEPGYSTGQALVEMFEALHSNE